MKNNRVILLLTALLVCMLPLAALADVPKTHMPAFYVNDYADIISAADEKAMIELGTQLEDETTAQVVVAAVSFLDGMDIEEYAYQMFTNWQLGQSDDENGVLLLFSAGDRDMTIMVGTDLESKLTASATGVYLEEASDLYLADNNFSEGIRYIYDALCAKVASIYGTSLSPAQEVYVSNDGAYYGYEDPRVEQSSGGGGGGIMGIIIGIVVIVVVFSIVGSLLRSAGNGSGCLTGWLIGRSTRPRRRSFFGGGWGAPPSSRSGGFGGAPRSKPRSSGRSTGSFGGGGGFGGGSRSGGGSSRPSSGGGRSSGPRTGGGGGTRGGGSSRKF